MRSGTTCFLLLALVLGAAVQSTVADRRLFAKASASSSGSSSSNDKKGSASASSSAISSGGESTAIAIATAETFKEVKDTIIDVFERVVKKAPTKGKKNKKKYCKTVLALFEEDLKAVGQAAVSAYAEAVGEVSVEGEGEACSNSAANVDAQVTAFSQAFVDAVVVAKNSVSRAEAEAQVGAQSVVFAKVFADAFASACTTSGFALANQQTFAEAVVEPVATVLVFLAAEVDCTGATGFSESISEAEAGVGTDQPNVVTNSNTESVGISTADAGGSGNAETGVSSGPCTGKYGVCCSSFIKGRDVCRCTASSNSRFFKCNAEKIDGGSKIVWQEGDFACNC